MHPSPVWHYLVLSLLAPSLLPAAPAHDGAVQRIGSQKQLFIDSHLLAKQSHITLTVNPAHKTGERNIVAEHPWENLALGYLTVLEVDGAYRMWYEVDSYGSGARQATEDAQEQKRVVNLAYATSKDGIHWEKPVLGLVDFHGSKENNLVLTNYFGTVFLDPRKSDGNLFKFAGSGRPNRGLEILTSPDGLRWKPLKDGPVLSKGHYDTQNQVLWDESLNKYVAFVRRWEGLDLKRAPLCCRKIGRSESDDLLSWPEPDMVYGHDESDPPESDTYNPSAVKYPGAPNAYLMFPSAYYHLAGHKNLGPLDVQLVTSRDGKSWNRVQRAPYIRLGLKGTPDGGSIYMGVGMLMKDTEIWMYYVGYDYLHGAMNVNKTRHSGVITRVVQRLDGFVSADAAYTGGEFTTVPVVFAGRQLSLNVDTGAMGELRIEILDASGRAIPGFGLQECELVNANHVAHTASWKGRKDLSELAGRPVKLRFVMRSTKLYAFQFKD